MVELGIALGPSELPPRARRILNLSAVSIVSQGTTSACAENTPLVSKTYIDPRNYLRVRGEYPAASNQAHENQELPPRARRILTLHRVDTHH